MSDRIFISDGVPRARALRSHGKDARQTLAHLNSPDGYSPRYQADQRQFAELLAAYKGGYVSMQTVIANNHARSVPPPLTQVPFIQNIPVANTPTLFMPGNHHRMSFIIACSAAATTIFLAYNAPPQGGFGIPIISPGFYQESNGTVSIDDLWITVSANNTVVVGYEGTLAL